MVSMLLSIANSLYRHIDRSWSSKEAYFWYTHFSSIVDSLDRSLSRKWFVTSNRQSYSAKVYMSGVLIIETHAYRPWCGDTDRSNRIYHKYAKT